MNIFPIILKFEDESFLTAPLARWTKPAENMLKYSVDDASCFAIQHQQSHWHGFSPQELKWWFCLSALTTTQAGTTHAPEVEASTMLVVIDWAIEKGPSNIGV